MTPPWDEWEAIVRRDPGERGVATYTDEQWPRGLGYGDLAAAASELAGRARRVVIVTGFCIVGATPPAAETDGPPGALYLAETLGRLDVPVTLLTDRYGLPLLAAGVKCWRLDRLGCELVEMPLDADRRWAGSFLEREMAVGLSHLASTERSGPSHTLASVEAEGTAAAEEFARLVPPEDRDVCHNMLGESIEAFTAPVHLLFEAVAEERPAVATIGIGDGGNEIGMGRFSWATLREAIRKGPGARTACRVATDRTIVAGVSDWGAYALALGTAAAAGRAGVAADMKCQRQEELIHTLVAAGAVDGVTRQRAAGVDGLALEEYLGPLAELRRSVGLTA